ncbi:tape measure protein [Mesorhizobium sp. M0938]|uniref:tape measure protein n=1 Tax=unclassified Mesorhizobium TaxID=325217 RepID=UPI0033362298
MAIVADQVIVELQAKVDRYNRNVINAERQFSRSMTSIRTAALGMSTTLVSAFAGTAALQGAQRLIDAATRIENALKVAGLSGAALEGVYDRLFESAQRNAAPVETLVTLYTRLSLAQQDLGVSNEEIIGFTDKIALALRVQGTTADEARGALIQLTQALGGGIVRAEEFNSIIEGAPTIMRAAAAGLEEAGGSVAKLRKLVIDGEVSSKAFFRAFEAGSVILEDKVANAELTVSQGFVRLTNAMINATREFAKGSGVATDLASAFQLMANTINSVDFEEFGGKVRAVIGWLNDVAGWLNYVNNAANNLGASIGSALGTDRVGEFLSGTDAGQALGMQSTRTMNERFGGSVTGGEPAAVKAVAEYAKRRADALVAEGVKTTDKTGRVPATPTVKPVSLANFAAPDAAKGAAASTKAAERAANDAAEQIDRAVADQTAIAVDAATLLLGKNENANRGEINSFLKAGGVDLDAATSAWCAAFVNSALAQVGVKGSGSNVATDFLNWGKGVSAANIQKGDVLVDSNGKNAGQTGGHVGFATGNLRATADGIAQIEMLSGNASDKVTTEWVNASEVVARRAADAFQIPADALSHLTQESTSAKVAADQLAASYKAWGQVAQTAVNGLATALADGKIEGRELLQILAQVVQQMLSMPSIGGSGGFGGFLSSLLGGIPGFANGTNSAPGGMAIVGERGPELINLPRGSQVIPNNRIGGAQQAQRVHVTVGVSANNNGNLLPFVEGVSQRTAGGVMKAGISKYDSELPGRFGDIMERQG